MLSNTSEAQCADRSGALCFTFADFTVGARYAVGSMLGEALQGRLGGLAVFNRALSDEQMRQLHDAAGLDGLK